MVIAWLYLIVVARMQVIMLMITGMIEILGMTVIGIAIIILLLALWETNIAVENHHF
jgi:hypothetical protein